MPLTTQQSPLVGGTGAHAMATSSPKRWVLAERGFMVAGRPVERGAVVELDARLAVELMAAHKVVPAPAPAGTEPEAAAPAKPPPAARKARSAAPAPAPQADTSTTDTPKDD